MLLATKGDIDETAPIYSSHFDFVVSATKRKPRLRGKSAAISRWPLVGGTY